MAAIRAAEGIDAQNLPDPVVQALHAAVETEDRATGAKYPQILVHCHRMRNLLTEKFRKFSGVVDMAVEIRVSHDRLNLLERQSRLYLDAVTAMLEDCRGEWGECVFQSGRYDVEFGAAKKGGRHFTQTTRVNVPVEVSLG